MKLKVIGILVLMALLFPIIFGACSLSPTEQIKQTEEQIEKETVAEGPILYDNGKNFLAVKVVTGYTYKWVVVMQALQDWCDQHPDKQLIFSPYSDLGSGVNLIYYKDK